MAVDKIDPKVIFASEAPAQDAPAVFTNKTVGWGESRKNGGRPTIKQSNALQQETDLKILWLNENSVTPFDATIDYPENAVTIKDGAFKILNSGVWEVFLYKSSVGLGNVDNTSDLNKPVSTATQTALNLKADKSATYTKVEVDNAIDLLKPPYLASDVTDGNQTQDQINLYGAKTYDMPAGGYPVGGLVRLDNGNIVKSTIDGNANDPNVNMTGWVLADAYLNTQKLQREFVSVWDFFTKAEKQAYNLALINGTLATFDCATQLQAFFNYIATNAVGTAYCSGTFYTSLGIVLGGASGCATKEVVGNLNIGALTGSSGHTLFLMQCGQDFKWFGSINPTGLGGGVFNNRSWRRGLVLGGEYQCAHTYVNSVYAYGFSEYGVLFDNLTTSSDIPDIRVTRCGSGYKLPAQTEDTNTWSDKTTFTLISENITTGTTQSSTIQVAKLPLADLRFNPTLYINGDMYHVSNVDYANSQMTIFPLLNRSITSGTARYVYGAGVCTAGSDASTIRIGKINSTNCGVIYHSGALYPALIYGTQTGQSNFIDVLLGGNSVSQAHVGGATISLYTEDSVFNIVRRTRAQLNWANLTNVALSLSKFCDLTRVRNPATNELDKTSVGLEGIMLSENGRWLIKENRGIAANDVKDIDVTDTNRSEYWHYGTSKTFNILAPDMPRLELLGYNRKSCIVMGTNNAGNPTGDVVFNAPAGYTVNGGPSVTFNGFTQAARFDVYLQYVRNNFVVSCSTLPRASVSASATYDPPSLAAAGTAGDSVTTTVTLTGATLGSVVQAAFSQYNAGVEISAQVSSANTVTVKFKNTSATAVDLASGTLTVKLI